MHAKNAQILEEEEHSKANQDNGADGSVVLRRRRRLNLKRRSRLRLRRY
jgi:hypothetical protein